MRCKVASLPGHATPGVRVASCVLTEIFPGAFIGLGGSNADDSREIVPGIRSHCIHEDMYIPRHVG
jgi:hypothetical protein